MSDVTQILSAIDAGDPNAAEQLLPLVYAELHKLAAQKLKREQPGQTLAATALVHEAYVRLVDVEKAQHWDGRDTSLRLRPRRCGGCSRHTPCAVNWVARPLDARNEQCKGVE